MELRDRTLSEAGERGVVGEIIRSLPVSPRLVDGMGHDAAFVKVALADDELLVVNTDRSGLNVAYSLGLAGGECVGDFGVSHSVSDVVAAGGKPHAVSIALLLPADTQVGFVLDVMKGAQEAASRYGATLACGDTKKNPKFAMVVTAIGTVKQDRRLTRSNARDGDFAVVTGHLGTMLMGTVAYRKRLDIDDGLRATLDHALIHQSPPFALGRALADAGVASACMDISDGLSGTLHAICSASHVGVEIDERALPVRGDVLEFAAALGLGRLQLTLAGGDWQYLYAIPPNKFAKAKDIADSLGWPLTAIGHFSSMHDQVSVCAENGERRELLRLEHDSFDESRGGMGYFDRLSDPQHCLGKVL